MINHKEIAAPTSENHLSTDQIYQYLNGNLSAEEMHQTEHHLLECHFCNDALNGLATIPEQETQRVLFDINHYVQKKSIRRRQNRIIHNIKNWGLTTAILFLLLFAAVVVWYQAKQSPAPNAPASVLITSQATPVGGLAAYDQYLKNNLQYPTQALQNNIQGEVILQFTVNPDSTLHNISVLKSLGYSCDEEAIRLLKNGPKWQPAQQNGRLVAAKGTLTVPFKLAP